MATSKQYASCEGIEKKLDGRIQPVGSSPDTDEEVHRNQHGLPKYIEQAQNPMRRTPPAWPFP